jgi:hypothetical protein
MKLRLAWAAAAAAVAAIAAFGFPAPAGAQYCEGTVHGLSRVYNLATGSGFLAVRARPSSSSRMIGQLFNGDHTTIFERVGSWYRVEIGGATGWAYARYMWNSCGY